MKFLGLWFAGDLLSLLSNLLNPDVLKFQILLSLFFVCNDIILCTQYYLFQPRGVDTHSTYELEDHDACRTHTSGHATEGTTHKILHAGALAATTLMVSAQGLDNRSVSTKNAWGQLLAWACACIYISSRCPQVWKNYKRKSVDGVSPLLFGSALLGNLTFTSSLFLKCNVGDSRHQYLIRQMPYMIGSSGTILFDVFYFYQRRIYGEKTYKEADIELI